MIAWLSYRFIRGMLESSRLLICIAPQDQVAGVKELRGNTRAQSCFRSKVGTPTWVEPYSFLRRLGSRLLLWRIDGQVRVLHVMVDVIGGGEIRFEPLNVTE